MFCLDMSQPVASPREKCALLATRTRKEAALLRAPCLRLELERRALEEARTIISTASRRPV